MRVAKVFGKPQSAAMHSRLQKWVTNKLRTGNATSGNELPVSNKSPQFPVGPFYFLLHQSKMPPMRPPVSNAFFCFASRLS